MSARTAEDVGIFLGLFIIGLMVFALVYYISGELDQAKQAAPSPGAIECASWGWDRLPGCGE